MRIVIDLNFPPGKEKSGSALFFADLMKDVMYLLEAHSVICLVAGHEKLPALLPPRITAYPIGKFVGSRVGQFFWYRFRLAAMLKKARADLYITADNAQFIDPAVNSCLLLIDTDITLKPVAKRFKNAIRAAGQVITISDTAFLRLQDGVFVAPQKVKRLPVSVKEPGIPLTWDEKEQLKTQYAAGREYFLLIADPAMQYNILALLKAFSAFKKWQHSNMQLVITGSVTWIHTVSALLQHYKYREDVHVLADLPERTCAALMDAAYAFVYPALTDHFPYRILQAVRAGIPVVCYAMPATSAIARTSVLYADGADFNDLSRNMQFLYKDEALRSRMIDDARTLLASIAGNDMAEQFRDFLNLSKR